MSFNGTCSSLDLTADERRSFKMKTNLLLDHIFGKQKPIKSIHSVVRKGERKMVGIRPIRPVKIDGKIYGSLTIASKALDTPIGTIRQRRESLSFKNYNYVK